MSKLYPPSEKSTFRYWLAHWFWFQKIAIKLKVWNITYLFHDIEKPLLLKKWNDYNKVRDYHRKNSRHHMEFDNGDIAPWLGCDYYGMAVDWECSRYTKLHAQYTAFQEMCNKIEKAFKHRDPVTIHQLYHYLLPVLEQLNLVPLSFYGSDLQKKLESDEWTKWDGSKAYERRYGRPAPIEQEKSLQETRERVRC